MTPAMAASLSKTSARMDWFLSVTFRLCLVALVFSPITVEQTGTFAAIGHATAGLTGDETGLPGLITRLAAASVFLPDSITARLMEMPSATLAFHASLVTCLSLFCLIKGCADLWRADPAAIALAKKMTGRKLAAAFACGALIVLGARALLLHLDENGLTVARLGTYVFLDFLVVWQLYLALLTMIARRWFFRAPAPRDVMVR